MVFCGRFCGPTTSARDARRRERRAARVFRVWASELEAFIQVHALLIQMVPGELNDELTTSDAMRRKLVHGIGHVLQKC